MNVNIDYNFKKVKKIGKFIDLNKLDEIRIDNYNIYIFAKHSKTLLKELSKYFKFTVKSDGWIESKRYNIVIFID